MTDASSAAFSDTPDASSAADDLRAAAEGNPPKGPASKTEEQAIALKEAAARKAGRLREIAGEKAETFKSSASGKIDSIRGGAGETADQIREVASEQWQETRLKAKQLHLSMEDYIRENPTKSVLTALGTGFVLGLLIRR
jgi:ElaB/YqjD/DUF883 family membrane-anchored ribosome-binding protein